MLVVIVFHYTRGVRSAIKPTRTYLFYPTGSLIKDSVVSVDLLRPVKDGSGRLYPDIELLAKTVCHSRLDR
jgi:hypothetical protein